MVYKTFNHSATVLKELAVVGINNFMVKIVDSVVVFDRVGCVLVGEDDEKTVRKVGSSRMNTNLDDDKMDILDELFRDKVILCAEVVDFLSVGNIFTIVSEGVNENRIVWFDEEVVDLVDKMKNKLTFVTVYLTKSSTMLIN